MIKVFLSFREMSWRQFIYESSIIQHDIWSNPVYPWVQSGWFTSSLLPGKQKRNVVPQIYDRDRNVNVINGPLAFPLDIFYYCWINLLYPHVAALNFRNLTTFLHIATEIKCSNASIEQNYDNPMNDLSSIYIVILLNCSFWTNNWHYIFEQKTKSTYKYFVGTS